MLIKIPRGLGREFDSTVVSHAQQINTDHSTKTRGEFSTSLIARLKLPKKLIITRSRQEKKTENKNRLDS